MLLTIYTCVIAGGTFVDLDKAMGIIMDTWLEQKKAEEDRAGAIFAQFDRTKDNLMPQSDFKRLMASLEGEGATSDRVQEVFDKLLKESAGMANDLIPGPVFRTAAWPIGIAGGSGYCKVEPPAALPAPVAFPEGMVFLSDIVPTIGKVVDEICESLKDTKSVAEELDNMRKLFGLVSNAANSQASGNEVRRQWHIFQLLLIENKSFVNTSRINPLLHYEYHLCAITYLSSWYCAIIVCSLYSIEYPDVDTSWLLSCNRCLNHRTINEPSLGAGVEPLPEIHPSLAHQPQPQDGAFA